MTMVSVKFLQTFMTLLLFGLIPAQNDFDGDIQTEELQEEVGEDVPLGETLQALLEMSDDGQNNGTSLDVFTADVFSLNNIAPLLADSSSNQVPENNIAFDLPDLTVTIETTNGEFQMEAYKSTNNDKILNELDKLQKTSQLIWVSVGQPMFVRTKLNSASVEKLFHTSGSGFYTYVQMLTSAQRKLLAQTATFKYVKLDFILVVDDVIKVVYANGVKILSQVVKHNNNIESGWFVIPSSTTQISIEGRNTGGACGMIGSDYSGKFFTDSTWRCSSTYVPGWTAPGFVDSHWAPATITTAGLDLRKEIPGIFDLHPSARLIWTSNCGNLIVYCRSPRK